jgi:hypothetical protein
MHPRTFSCKIKRALMGTFVYLHVQACVLFQRYKKKPCRVSFSELFGGPGAIGEWLRNGQRLPMIARATLADFFPG